MKRPLPRVNLKTDLPPGSEMEKRPKKTGPRYLILVAGLFALIALLFYFKGPRRPRVPPKEMVKPEAPHPKPSIPKGNTRETSPPSRVTPKAQEQASPSPPLKPSEKETLQKPKMGEALMRIALFPGQYPQHVKGILRQKGIDFQAGKMESTTTLWRVMVKASSPGGTLESQKLGKIMRVTPWKLKKKGAMYLVVASLKDRDRAQRLTENLKGAGFPSTLSPVSGRVKLEVFSFTVKKREWDTLKPLLEKLGAQVLEEQALDHKASLSQPTSTTSQGNGSPLPLSR